MSADQFNADIYGLGAACERTFSKLGEVEILCIANLPRGEYIVTDWNEGNTGTQSQMSAN